MKEKKKNHTLLLILLFVLFLVGILLVLFAVKSHFSYGTDYMDSAEYFEAANEEQVVIVKNQNIEETHATLIEGVPYASYDYIRLHLSPAVYWDQESQAILYTTEAGTEMISPGGEEVRLLDNGEVYISLAYAAEKSGLTYGYYENPNRVILNDRAEEKNTVTAQADTEIRYRAGIKSDILRNIPAGEELQYLDTLDDWLHVATADGFSGYVPSKHMSDVVTEMTEEAVSRSFTPIHMDTKVNLIWHQTTSVYSNDAFGELSAEMTGVNVVSPTWFSVLDNAGNLFSVTGPSYVEAAHARGMQVWGLIDNFNPNFDTEKALSSATVRAYIIAQLINEAVACGMDGINVDFEALSEGAISHYIQFLRELTLAAHPYHLTISVDTSVPQSYTYYYRRGIQASIVDYMILMGYDEHYAGSETAGSVASLPFVREGIENMMEEGISADSIVCGVPFYTRLWTTSAGTVSSEVLSMDEADQVIAEHGMSKNWDEQSGQYVAVSEGTNTVYQIWMEEEESLRRKVSLVAEYGIAGCAAWKLGFERATVWNILAEAVS